MIRAISKAIGKSVSEICVELKKDIVSKPSIVVYSNIGFSSPQESLLQEALSILDN